MILRSSGCADASDSVSSVDWTRKLIGCMNGSNIS